MRDALARAPPTPLPRRFLFVVVDFSHKCTDNIFRLNSSSLLAWDADISAC